MAALVHRAMRNVIADWEAGCNSQNAHVRRTVRSALLIASSTSVTSCCRFGSAARVCPGPNTISSRDTLCRPAECKFLPAAMVGTCSV